MALEPLLSEFDGVEIAAAALRLLERERAEPRSRRVEAERPVARPDVRPADRAERPVAPRGGQASFTRVFLSIGDRDGVRPGDLVGAITGETGITSDRIGKLDIRDSHTVAEIAAADADAVIEKMNGVSLKGRRIAARVDDRPAPRSREGSREGAREGRSGGRDARPSARGGARGGFGDRGRDRPPRDGGAREGRFSREGRPSRGFGRDRADAGERRPRRDDAGERRPRRDDDRPRARGGFRDRPDEGRVPRAAREREEWSERADRVRNARRPRRDEA
jgi:ATP-dependent RNA helicase DeaD